jgi:hypothetical protein
LSDTGFVALQLDKDMAGTCVAGYLTGCSFHISPSSRLNSAVDELKARAQSIRISNIIGWRTDETVAD